MERLPIVQVTQGQQREMISEIIRFETFEKLNLTHTCCSPAFDKLFDRQLVDSKINEIQEEERQLIARHEELVREFEDKYEDGRGTASSFLRGYWKTRMREVFEAGRSMNEEESNALRELGMEIVTDPDAEDNSDSSGDDSIIGFDY